MPMYCKANHDDTATPAASPCSRERTKVRSFGEPKLAFISLSVSNSQRKQIYKENKSELYGRVFFAAGWRPAKNQRVRRDARLASRRVRTGKQNRTPVRLFITSGRNRCIYCTEKHTDTVNFRIPFPRSSEAFARGHSSIAVRRVASTDADKSTAN